MEGPAAPPATAPSSSTTTSASSPTATSPSTAPTSASSASSSSSAATALAHPDAEHLQPASKRPTSPTKTRLNTAQLFGSMRLRKTVQARKELALQYRIPDECVEEVDGTKRLTNVDKLPQRPAIVFINKKSGGGHGEKLLNTCLGWLHPVQVVDLLAEKGAEKGLELFGALKKPFRVVAAGGDGSIAWVLQGIDKTGLGQYVEVIVLPLGTGNDLARVLGWGSGYDGINIGKFLNLGENKAVPVHFDRWLVTVSLPSGDDERFYMNNYFSIGGSAAIAARFDEGRKERPGMYNSRLMNKLIYTVDGLLDTIERPCRNLHEKIAVECDGKALTLPEFEDFIVLNIPSFASGTDLWHLARAADAEAAKSFTPALMFDGKMEIVAVRSSLQMGTIKVGLSHPTRLAQPKSIVITNKQNIEFPLQIDGEPIKAGFTQITIVHHNNINMMMLDANDNPDKRRSSAPENFVFIDSANASDEVSKSLPSTPVNGGGALSSTDDESSHRPSADVVDSPVTPANGNNGNHNGIHNGSSGSDHPGHDQTHEEAQSHKAATTA